MLKTVNIKINLKVEKEINILPIDFRRRRNKFQNLTGIGDLELATTN